MPTTMGKADNRALIIIGLISFIAIGLYFYKFHGGFSDDQSIWGSFGDYMGVVVGTSSVVLVFITYKEQRRSNYNERVRDLLKFRLGQILKKESSLSSDIRNIYDKTMKCFVGDIPSEKYRDPKPFNLLVEALSSVYTACLRDYGKCKDYERLLARICTSISSIDQETMLSKSEKEVYVNEIFMALSKEMHILFFFHIVTYAKEEIINMLASYKVFEGLFVDIKILQYMASHIEKVNEVIKSTPLEEQIFTVDMDDMSKLSFTEVIDKIEKE